MIGYDNKCKCNLQTMHTVRSITLAMVFHVPYYTAVTVAETVAIATLQTAMIMYCTEQAFAASLAEK